MLVCTTQGVCAPTAGDLQASPQTGLSACSIAAAAVCVRVRVCMCTHLQPFLLAVVSPERGSYAPSAPSKGSGENPFCLFQLLVAPGKPWLISSSVCKWPSPLASVCQIPPPFSYTDTSDWLQGPLEIQADHILRSLN